MHLDKKNDLAEEFKRSSKSKPRQVKRTFHPIRKQVFLTDTQTSDYTKSSTQMQILKISQLTAQLRQLRQQNAQLKQTLMEIKASSFFQLNEEKIKQLIRQNQKLKSQQRQIKAQLQQSLVQRDFLKRFSKNLKIQCESLTNQILSLKNKAYGQNIDTKRLVQDNSSSEDLRKKFSRSASSQLLTIKRKKARDQPQNQKIRDKNYQMLYSRKQKNAQNSLNSEYFHKSINDKVFKFAV